MSYFVDALAGHRVTPAADTVLELLQANPHLVEPGNFSWDPLAAVVATQGSPAAFEERRVVVLQDSPEVDGELLMSSAGALSEPRWKPTDELAAFVRGVGAAEDAQPPTWVGAWTDAPPGGSALAPWVLAPGAHAVVCVVQGTAVILAQTIEVSG